MISFTSLEFIPVIGSQFYTTFAHNQFLYLNENIVASLSDCDGLGACTDVIVMGADKALKSYVIKQYTWSRPASKPFGIPVDHQCRKCKALRTFKAKKAGGEKITVRCSNCLTMKEYQRPSGLSYCRRNGAGYSKDNDPEWMERVLSHWFIYKLIKQFHNLHEVDYSLWLRSFLQLFPSRYLLAG